MTLITNPSNLYRDINYPLNLFIADRIILIFHNPFQYHSCFWHFYFIFCFVIFFYCFVQ